jgi:hypothetical protein
MSHIPLASLFCCQQIPAFLALLEFHMHLFLCHLSEHPLFSLWPHKKKIIYQHFEFCVLIFLSEIKQHCVTCVCVCVRARARVSVCARAHAFISCEKPVV